MAIITLKTTIKAPLTLCFDLARSIDLHRKTMQHTQEKAIAGTTSGLIGKGQQVTWEAKHFGITFRMTSKITRYDYPYHFVDQMVSGPFAYLVHDHHFEQEGPQVIMTDRFVYRSPWGILGRLADFVFMKRYMKKLLERRNQQIKAAAESLDYQKYLDTLPDERNKKLAKEF